MVMIYEVYEMTLGLLVIAFSPDLKSAGLMLVFIVTLFNWFNGVVVPYDQIQVFWRYWVSLQFFERLVQIQIKTQVSKLNNICCSCTTSTL